MEILGLIGFHFLLAPFVAWWALSWWIIIPCAVAFMISISALMPSRGKYGKVNHASAAICLAIIGILTATGIGYNSKDTGFWLSALEGAKFFVKFFAVYVTCGIVTLLPLWYVNVRRIGKSLKRLYNEFIEETVRATDRYSGKFERSGTLTNEQKEEVRKCNGMKDGKLLPYLQVMLIEYKKHCTFPSINAKDNMGLISSLLFLWPIHCIVEILGELIAKIPEHVARLLRLPLNWISRAVVRGLPEDVK